ncbi:hypothetical protein RclHR1_03160002 [Rhizophagus clarus]|uniref:HTH myb-type domain-containing protein n=1 Tax=Rhizophagus clarus TaxID=94130 RepID=A0A2Z6RAX8_9GLOM|nr:hypothetical protein RclHR1_03160002 [Rhizophagus clarus]GET03638.1 hypothetical protein GLOIN_2v1671871 [Rhizophagus clarus]
MKIKGQRFTKEVDDIISEYMKKWGHLSNPYMKIHEKIPKYSSKQIRYRWISKLNPRRNEVKSKFGKLRSENTLKNFWHLRNRSLLKQKKEVNHELNITFEYENANNINPSYFKEKDEENVPPLLSNASRIEILCWVAEEQYKRDFPHKYFNQD